MADAASPQTPLRVIGGFELIEKIGQGAMGTVFKAHQRSLDRVVALKILPPSIAKDAQFIDRFQREARSSARFTHPNIVMGIDVGQDQATGLWYFAMEYVDGPSVKQVMDQKGPLPERRAIEIACEIAQALDCAASHQIVHRDVKPDNILLTSDGKAKLADLGLARRIHGEDASLTQEGQAVGTPLYMAPEQIRGQLDQIDIRTDFYSLGCTLFHMITGQTPFDGPTNAVVMSKHLAEKPPLAHRVSDRASESCGRLIARLMQKNRDQRLQTPGELITALERLLSPTATRRAQASRATTGPRRAVRASGGAPTPDGKKPNRAATAIIVAVLVLAGGGFLAAILLSRGGKPEEQAAAKPEPTTPPVTTSQKTPNPPPPNPASKPETDPVKADPEKKPEPPGPDPDKEPSDTDPATEEPPLKNGGMASTEEPPPDDPVPGAVLDAEKKDKAPVGFVGNIYSNADRTTPVHAGVSRPTLDFSWPKGVPEGLSLTVGAFASFGGDIRPAQTGPCVFEVSASMSCRFYINGLMLVDLWNTKGTVRTPPIQLDRNRKYKVSVAIFSRRSEANAGVRWGPVGAPLMPLQALAEEEGVDLPVGEIAGGWSATYASSGETKKEVTRRDWTVCFDWGSGSPAPGIAKDKFHARWTGVVVPPVNGDYTFHLDSDDGGRVIFGDTLILDSRNAPRKRFSAPPVRLEAGKRYAAAVSFYEGTYSAKCKFTWTVPDGKEEPVPAMGQGDEDLTPLQVGFLADHWQSGETVMKRREIQAGWLWGSGSPGTGLNPNSFVVTYTGWITPPKDGIYTFVVEHQGALRFFVDDVLLISNVNRRVKLEGGTPELTTVPLEGGKHYFLRAVYHGRSYDDRLCVRWSAEGVPEQLVQGLPPASRRATDAGTGRVETALLAEYGTGRQATLKRLEGRISHDFGSGSPSGDVPADGFWGRWRGGLTVPKSGKYQFRVSCDNFAEVKINRVRVLRTEKEGKGDSEIISLQKGATYLLEMSYHHRSYASNVHLYWRGPDNPKFVLIPAEVFVLAPADKKTPRRLP